MDAVFRRLELLKLEGLGFSQAEIVKELSMKCACSRRTVYNDFEHYEGYDCCLICWDFGCDAHPCWRSLYRLSCCVSLGSVCEFCGSVVGLIGALIVLIPLRVTINKGLNVGS